MFPNDMLTPTFLAGAIQERPERNAIRQNYIGESLFPRRDVSERRVMWDSLVSENNLAGFYSSKGHAVPGSDVSFATHFRDLVDIKASRYLDPDIVGKVRDPGMAAVVKVANDSFTIKGIQQRVNAHVADNLAWCDDAVDAQLEYMAVRAMTGTLVWPPKAADGTDIVDPMPHWNPDMELTVNFNLRAEFNQKATTLEGYKGRDGAHVAWNNPNGLGDPIKDLEVIAQLMVEETGLDAYGATIIMSRSTLSELAFQPNMLRWITGFTPVGGTGGAAGLNTVPAEKYADINAVKAFIETRLGYTIRLYDSQWTYRTLNKATGTESIKRVKFLEEGKLIILPKGTNPGYMAMAPHETQDGAFTSGKVPWVFREPKPPYMREMGVSVVAFPILVHPEEIFVYDVYN